MKTVLTAEPHLQDQTEVGQGAESQLVVLGFHFEVQFSTRQSELFLFERSSPSLNGSVCLCFVGLGGVKVQLQEKGRVTRIDLAP